MPCSDQSRPYALGSLPSWRKVFFFGRSRGWTLDLWLYIEEVRVHEFYLFVLGFAKEVNVEFNVLAFISSLYSAGWWSYLIAVHYIEKYTMHIIFMRGIFWRILSWVYAILGRYSSKRNFGPMSLTPCDDTNCLIWRFLREYPRDQTRRNIKLFVGIFIGKSTVCQLGKVFAIG